MSFFKGRSIVSIDDLTTDELRYIFKKAGELKEVYKTSEFYDRYSFAEPFVTSAIFLEDSTRTLHSFKSSALQMESMWDDIPKGEGSSLSKGETIYDTAMTLKGYGTDLLITRTKAEGVPRYLSDNIGIPVFNAGDGKNEHPTQTILDMFTIDEIREGNLDETSIAMVGDLVHGRTVHSLVKGMCRFSDVTFNLVAPDFLQMPEKYKEIIIKSGNTCILYDSIDELLSSTSPDIIYMTRLQLERHKDDIDKVKKASRNLRLTGEHVDVIRDTKIMHPMPRDKYRSVIPKSFDTTPSAWYWKQSQNGMFTRMVEILMTAGELGDDFIGEEFRKPTIDSNFYEDIQPENRGRKRKGYTIRPLLDGVVVDHIPIERSEDIMRLIKKEFTISGIENYGGEFRSLSTGDFKGIYMISGIEEFNDNQLLRLAAIAPGTTYNFIIDGKVRSKKRLSMPPLIENFESIQCMNPECITNPEYHETLSDEGKFHKVNDKYECHYCGTYHDPGEIWSL